MKVLGFTRVNEGMGLSGVSYYRVALPLEALDELTGHQAVTYDQIMLENMFRLALDNGKNPDMVLEGHDIYVLGRLYHDDHADEFIDGIRNQGGLVVLDTDDDLTEKHRHLDSRGIEFINQIKRVDLVTVSTPYLARRISKYVDYKPPILPNHLNVRWFSQASLEHKRKYDGLTLGVIGTPTHYNDWLFLEGVFERLSKKYDVTILVAGYQPDYLEQYEHLPPVPYINYPGLMREFDIVCCALDPDDGFNKSKSGIKALEAMAAARSSKKIGAVPVCTDMPVYRRVVNHGHNGLLVDNDDWYEALEMLIRDKRTRNRLAYRGHKWVRDNRDIKQGYRLWKRAYSDLLEGHYGTQG